MFVSRSSLWSNLNCVDADKTRVYLERSGTSPINLQLHCGGFGKSSVDTFVQIIPQAIARLKSLSVSTDPGYLEGTMSHLSHPAPLLETLDIDSGCCNGPQYSPVLAPTIFNGNLSSLRELHLYSIRTGLSWRNMANLTSFTLHSSSVTNFGQLLDFFESAPHLRNVHFHLTTLISGGENGRLVSLDRLRRMRVVYCGPTTSILFDHLVIPVGAKLVTQPDMGTFTIEDHIPGSLDNFKNLSSITEIHLFLDIYLLLLIRLRGPYGELRMLGAEIDNSPSLVFESLARFDTSKTERLRIDSTNEPLSRDLPYRILLPMENLRTLVLSRCTGLPRAFMDALNPNTSLSKEVVCPSLEELVFVCRPRENPVDDGEEEFDMRAVIEMAAARASRGVKIGTVKDQAKLDLVDVLELRKHVSYVEHGPGVDVGTFEYESDGSDVESD